MNGSSFNSYFWFECDPYDGESGGPSAGFVILNLTYAVEFVLGFPSNLWLAWLILNRRSKVDGILSADFLPFSLILIKMPFYAMVPLTLGNHFLWENLWIMGLTTFWITLFALMKPLLMFLVCLEKYLAVVRPLDFQRFKAFKYKWSALVVLFCCNVGLSIGGVLHQSIVTVCVIFVPILAADSYCCVAVLKSLRKSPPGDRQDVSKEKKSNAVANRERPGIKRKAFFLILLVQVALIVNYVPLIVTIPMQGLVPARVLKCQYTAMALAASLCGSYLYPLFYLYNDVRHHKKTKSKI